MNLCDLETFAMHDVVAYYTNKKLRMNLTRHVGYAPKKMRKFQ